MNLIWEGVLKERTREAMSLDSLVYVLLFASPLS